MPDNEDSVSALSVEQSLAHMGAFTHSAKALPCFRVLVFSKYQDEHIVYHQIKDPSNLN